MIRVEPAAQRRPPFLPMFRKLDLHARDVLGSIDAEVRFCRLDNANFKAVLKGSQLLERLRLLQRRWWKRCKSSQHRRLIAVQAHVTLPPSQWRAREVKC